MIKLLPRWKSHKIVEAFEIEEIRGVTQARLLGSGYSVFVSDEYIAKHHPAIGGYYVRYEDGYESWSPKEAFENGYSRIEEDEE